MKCHRAARDALRTDIGGATGLGEALLEAGGYKVDLDGERRRVLEVCARRYRALFEAGLISTPACAALDHVAKEAAFSCDAELQRWSDLGRLCDRLLRFSEFPFGLGALALNL